MKLFDQSFLWWQQMGNLSYVFELSNAGTDGYKDIDAGAEMIQMLVIEKTLII